MNRQAQHRSPRPVFLWAALAACITLLSSGHPIRAQLPPECYRVETVTTPPGVTPAVTAVAFDARGHLLCAFRRGSIWRREPATGAWQRFASGLLWPLGMVAGEAGEAFVVQMPELTRIVDTDGDGTADVYETICDLWGLSGNYHEFSYGPVRDSSGNFFIGLGLASAGGPTRAPMRGEPPPIAPRGKLRGHHSPVPYRGWIVKVTRDGEMIPYAAGFRQPNGLVFGPEGTLFTVDNQGDWKGTSPFYEVVEGAFYGHPTSLVWASDAGEKKHPQELSVEEIDGRRRTAAVELPQNDLAGSAAQPVLDTTGGKFGPYSGQFIVAEWTHARLYRIALEKVAGEYQGACFPFIERVPRSNLRMAFAPDGSLYVGQCSLPWFDGPEGLQRVVWTGKMPMDILRMSLRRDGFELTFTKPLERAAAETIENYSLQHYHYRSTQEYGSPRHDATPVELRGVEVTDDGLSVRLLVDSILTGKIYDLRTRQLHGVDGDPLATTLAAYTVRHLLPND